jgi:hypothetical protein
VLIKLGEIHIKMVNKARSWMKGDQSKWSKLTLGEDEEVKTSPKAKVYARGFVFTS